MSTKRLCLLALFIALSVIGAMIKIPSFVGSIALDAFPSLLAAVLIGKRAGALIAGAGHLVSALIAGMPLGPMHLLIAVEMALIVWSFGAIYQSGNTKLAGLFFVCSNSLLAPLPMLVLLGVSFYFALLPSLLIGATVNAAIAIIFIPKCKMLFQKTMAGEQ
ncbi:ECF transporter S component [Virgibacillus phasianinus]|uniref:ECF transporter S component n=1 Tax=Virgibacillus phasianinus TaxID=2017483 RepID=A0A220U142_9BACI|nr:ECF transporter S component [Virgibacillus phasianinus]ASK61848.1 ECF transporter S component [Virgibacillus phasianinus]